MWMRSTKVLLFLPLIGIAPAARAQDTKVTMRKTVPFEDPSLVKKDILDNCKLPEKSADAMKKAAADGGINLVQDDAAARAGRGRILTVQIAGLGGGGGFWLGKSVSVALKGKLVEGGKELGNFAATTTSTGGLVGSFKSTCGIYVRDMEFLSRDIMKWLKSPTKDAKLGELK